ncbi:cadherin-86C isoform X1 [Drosophila pseudoobscura]|uniref:Cadherin-86C isoform X1 n=1 Tax=Drosophila pseudoobscura pseudoobscura TaxID=46245 RepID=A0A6I8V354_DROPS|nr:cadherin-86C isoform X1 [Drosophila pseudoobscura]
MASNSSSQSVKNKTVIPPRHMGKEQNGLTSNAGPILEKECYYYTPTTSQQHQQIQQGWLSLWAFFGPWLSAMTAYRLLTISLLIGILCPHHIQGVDPKFDPSTRMRLVLVPADAQVNSVIYRLRATDEEFDYPLTFEFVGDAFSSTVKVDSLPCTKYNSVCQANIVLQRRLEPGRYYDFQVSVKDSKGGMATQLCSITATNFTTPHDLIFPHKPGIIMIPEDAKRGTELNYVIARKNPLFQKPVYLELWGSPLFAIRQKIVSSETTEGTVFLLGPLDFEKQAMYHLTILANDAYAEPGQDSRNIAGMEIVVIVQDVQDQPPVFTSAPPVTKLPTGILPGDKILQVHAEDGDKGNPREIRFGLVSENNPFTSFFDINDTSGEIFLMRPLEDIAFITHVGDPVLLTVIAEEVKVGRDEPPALASTVQLAFFLPDRTNSPPYFENDHYVSRVDENAPQGTALIFVDPYVPRIYDDDTGKNGVFSLTLLNNNGTFEITPNVAERSASFLVRVRDNTLLDYEMRHSVQFQVMAQEVGPATNLTAVVNVTVYINDVNDNAPVFDQPSYTVELPENMTVGTKVVQVHATDLDSGLGGKVRYTAILGYLNTSVNLDAENGLITISTNNHGYDREVMPEYHLYVEARDMDGEGNRAQVPLIIKLIDVNDETPIFDKDLYEFILTPDLLGFTTTAVINAEDKDATAPNNEVRYELISGNYENKFKLDKVTGELTIQDKIHLRSMTDASERRHRDPSTSSSSDDDNEVFILTARAYDLGVPVRFSTTTIRIYPPESRKRMVTFVVPGHNPDKAKTEETLSAITGGKVLIHSIRPLRPDEPGAKDIPVNNPGIKDRSVVTATVLYGSTSLVDISDIQQRLSQHNNSYAIMPQDDALQTNNLTPLQTQYKAENKVLFWLLILLATLVAFTVLILLLCCICSWCPLYGAATKRIVNISKAEDDVHLVHREMANGKHTKSVQVAEWMGRRDAWSAEKPPNTRTKPTRWEFHDGREHPSENVGRFQDNREKHHVQSAEEQQGRIRKQRTAKDDLHLSFHNSRTNLINDRDVYMEDLVENRDIVDDITRNREIKQLDYAQRQRCETEAHQIDDDSMRRHEIDRGSDMDFPAAQNSMKSKREMFIKEGNVEILQLMTRDKIHDGAALDDDNIYVNVPLKPLGNLSHPQLLMVDNTGKEILMRRFIEEQPDGKQIIREHYQIVPGATYIQSMPNEVQQASNLKVDTYPLVKSGPNSIVYSQMEPEVKVIHTQPEHAVEASSKMRPAISNHSLTQELEQSLKQQNSLLRQILLEKDKLESGYTQEVALETQSLPGQSMAIGTQTDCDAGTQTDTVASHIAHTSVSSQAHMKTKSSHRRARSENDESMSEDGYEYVRFIPPNSPEGTFWIKRRRTKKRRKQPRKRIVMVEEVKRKIRTPIKEEEELHERKSRVPPKKPMRETKTSILRKQLSDESRKTDATSNGESKASALLKSDVLIEVTDSFDENKSTRNHSTRKILVDKYYKHSDGEFDDGEFDEGDDTEYSFDSDGDEIVIRTSAVVPSRGQKSDQFVMEPKEKRNLSFSPENMGGIKQQKYPRTQTPEEAVQEAQLNSIPRLSRRDSKKRDNNPRRQTSSEPPHNRLSVSKFDSIAIEDDNTPPAATSLIDRSYQSEAELGNLEGARERNVPKYMEWYYNKKKSSLSGRTSTESSKSQPANKKKGGSSEKRVTKTRIAVQNQDSDFHDDGGKYKPEPAPRRSAPKGSRLLKEDRALNKQHRPKKETYTNHPLLQHSEHRFERESAIEVPAQPTKLPHYMYPETPPYAATASDKELSAQRQQPKPSPIKENEVKVTNSKINLLKQGRSLAHQTSSHAQKQLNASTLEDDHDSGIAMNSLLNSLGRRNPIAEKKSVFSIAYDDVSRVKKIPSGGESPQYS